MVANSKIAHWLAGACLAVALASLAPSGTSQVAEAASCGPRTAQLQQGPRGGCFYINRNGNKTYVDRSCCR